MKYAFAFFGADGLELGARYLHRAASLVTEWVDKPTRFDNSNFYLLLHITIRLLSNFLILSVLGAPFNRMLRGHLSMDNADAPAGLTDCSGAVRKVLRFIRLSDIRLKVVYMSRKSG
jgi:hypothetical protein